MRAFGVTVYRGKVSTLLSIYGLLVISTGLGAISLGGAGGGNIRLWEVSLVAFVFAMCFNSPFKRNMVLLISPSLSLAAGYVIAVLLSGLNAIDSAMWQQRSALVLAMSLLFFVFSQRYTQKEFGLYLKIIIYSGIFFSVVGMLDVYLFFTAPDIFGIIHQFDGGAQFAQNGAGDLASYNLVARARGFFTEPNEFSQYLILPFGFILAVAFFQHQKAGTKLLCLFGLLIVLFAQVMSQSRGGLLGFFVEILGLLLVTKISGVKRKIRIKNYLPIVFVVVALIAAGILYVGENIVAIFVTVVDRVGSTGTSNDWTTDIRLMNYQHGFDSASASLANLLVGVGAGNLDFSYVHEATTSNQFLDVLVETGIIGFIFYFMTILSLLWLSYKFMKNRLLSSNNELFVVFVGAYLSFLGMLVGGMTYPTHMLFFFWLNAGLLLAVCKFRAINTPATSSSGNSN